MRAGMPLALISYLQRGGIPLLNIIHLKSRPFTASVQYCTDPQVLIFGRVSDFAQRHAFLSGKFALSKDLNARALQEVIPMRRHRLSRLHLLLIVPLTLLTLSPRLAWTQETHSADKTPPQLSNLAARFVAVPEGELRFHPAYQNLALPFAPIQRQTSSQMRLRSIDIGYHLPPPKNNALPRLWQLAKTDEPQVRANHFIANAPAKWLIDVTSHNRVHYRSPGPGGDVPYDGQPVPWVGRIILSIGQQAKFHPRVAHVLGVINPGLGAGNPTPTGGPTGNTHVVVGRGPFR
jgi:hypothetical protein